MTGRTTGLNRRPTYKTYLDLLLTEQSALQGVRFMTAVIRGAEAAILHGARDHAQIEEREIETVKSLPQ